MPTRPKPTILIVLDGFGVAPPGDGNAISQAKTPNITKYLTTYPVAVLKAASQEVGLQFGEMGNSEVGHLTIGAGRILYQNLPRIDRAVESGDFAKNEAFLEAMRQTKEHDGTLHLVGIASTGGVHGHLKHALALLELAKKQKLKKVFIHAILDGRDTLPSVAADFIKTLQEKCAELKIGAIASLSGRYYAMDRDNNWGRVEQAYRAIAEGKSEHTTSDPLKAIAESYEQKVYDEEFVPTVVVDGAGKPLTTVQPHDAVIFWNFRADRARQLTKAFVLPDFDKFERPYIADLMFVTTMEYEKDLPVTVAFPPEGVPNPLAKVISDAKLKQLHIAETEKYAHVTFFFNGLQDVIHPGEDQVVIPSPKIASYDQQPEMSAKGITDRVLQELKKDTYDFILINFANPDMVGHTGNLAATVTAVETVDTMVGKIVDVALAKGGAVFITADHGNAEDKINLQTGEKLKDHSTNPVPFMMMSKAWEGQTGGLLSAGGADLSVLPPSGMLADIAPTILKTLKLKVPKEMTGVPLI